MKIFDYRNRCEKAKNVLEAAGVILIGGGAGLSDAAGLKFSGKRFTDNFASFIEKYGFKDLYTSSFYPFKTQEERWAYWAKHIAVNRYDEPPMELYQNLFTLVQDKEYFALTTNVDHQFVKSGFPEEKVFAVQGNYGFLQCEYGCHNTLYYNEDLIKEMIENTQDSKIPSALVPKCPVCGNEMDCNLRHTNDFVQDENWYKAEKQYTEFIKSCKDKKVVYLELGVGFNTPGIIRFPFEQMTYQNENATLIRINRDYPDGEKENSSRTISFTEDMSEIIKAFLRQGEPNVRTDDRISSASYYTEPCCLTSVDTRNGNRSSTSHDSACNTCCAAYSDEYSGGAFRSPGVDVGNSFRLRNDKWSDMEKGAISTCNANDTDRY